MTISIKTIPCLSDNYAYLIHNEKIGETALVDAPEANPIIAEIDSSEWNLDYILLTHHHFDHVDGVEKLRQKYGSKVIGNKNDIKRLPNLDIEVTEKSKMVICDQEVSVLDVPGHTLGHIAFVFPGAAFTADSLMALGCGRVFEGTFSMMWNSLQKIAALPRDTMIYSGHEYTLSNGAFALTLETGNPELIARVSRDKEQRNKGLPTVPSKLDLELRTNPFMRAGLPEMKAIIGSPDMSDEECFAEIRKRKDQF
ncbi:MAG: hydroxyacylglutathione hydrolase [Rhodobacteraceae bacterium]|nr:hydroxyacylglutathione hydrolase [Paracoccaceae bacterium]